jgi:hypothetical protein
MSNAEVLGNNLLRHETAVQLSFAEQLYNAIVVHVSIG